MLNPGDLWDDRYRLVERIGAGGMAAVWLARDERLDREVALKLISDVLAGDREYLTRFEREARVAAGLNHANLVTIFDFAVADERPYLVMELVSGGTIAAAGPLQPPELERLAEEMLAALEHIHSAGVVHRDLKPANVLIDDHRRFRLTDFGIAQPSDATALTQTGQLIGTMKYMAPEVRAGEPATERSDLYSLGVLLRECGAEAVPSLAPLLEAISREDPAGRPASAGQAAALLRVATLPTRALPATERTERVASPGGRRRSALVAGALALGAMVALGVVLSNGGGDERPSSISNEPPPAMTAPASEEPPPPPETTEQAPAAPPQAEPEPEPAQPTCDEIEEQKRALEEQRKADETAAGKDKEAREAIKAEAEEQKKALEEQKKDCVK